MSIRLDKTGFGRLEIYQNPDEFCYGVDAVLLAAFAAENPKCSKDKCRIMDLGTGSGIVPLILSHKTKAGVICGLEVQENSWKLAEKNRLHNDLTERLRFYHGDVKEFCLSAGKELAGTFEVVTSNPPYTAGNCGIESSSKAKAIARHETTASLDDFIKTARSLLCEKGDFYMVHRPSRLVDICDSCRKYDLEPKEMRFISGKPFEKPNIVLVHCVKGGKRELKMLDPLFVHLADGTYSPEILKIYEKA